jgi:hypothetical protein
MVFSQVEHLVKYDMIYYPMYIDPTYSFTYLFN